MSGFERTYSISYRIAVDFQFCSSLVGVSRRVNGITAEKAADMSQWSNILSKRYNYRAVAPKHIDFPAVLSAR